MNTVKHHTHRLIQRMLQAETATSRSEAQKVLRKFKKHQRQLSKFKQMIRGVFGRGG